MKTILLILGWALCSASLIAQTAPPQAVAAGFNNLAFDDEFASNTYTSTKGKTPVAGANWYPYFWAAASNVTIANGMATITNGNIGSTPSYYTSLGTGTTTGSFYHGYFEARMQFAISPGTATSAATWPAFWMFGVDPQSTGSFNCPECDIFEAYPLGGTSFDPVQTLHNWSYPKDTDTGNTENTSQMLSLQGSNGSSVPNDGAYHTYGALWQSTGNGTGQIQFYYDNFLVVHQNNTTAYKTGTGTNLPGLEQNAMSLILQGGPTQPINVSFVHAFTAGSGTVTPPVTITQTLTLPTSLSTTQSPYALPATTSAGIAPTYSIVSGPSTVTGNRLYLSAAGTVILNASASGTTTATQIVSSLAETATITVTAPPPVLAPQTVTESYSLAPAITDQGLPLTFSLPSGSPAKLSGTTLTAPAGTGAVVVNVSQAGNSTYAPYTDTETVTFP